MATEMELRRVQDGVTLVRNIVPDEASFILNFPPYARPIGKMQWYWRRSGNKRWFKMGGVFSYDGS